MNSAEIIELETDIYEAFEEVGDRFNIEIRQLLESEPNFYREQKQKGYGTPTLITGRVKLSPTTEELSDTGRRQNVNAVFTFTSKHLRDSGMLDGNTVQFTTQDIVQYDERKFNIINIVPSSLVGNTFLIFKVETREI